MALSYTNYAKDKILEQMRNIRYANGEMLFGFYNSVEQRFILQIDIQQLSNQADVFSREILTHRSKFDLKRFLGQYQDDWLRILHETYVYDRLKCIYYGINSINLMDLPEGLYSFPGNIILANLLSKNTFNYSTNDQQPFSLYINITYNSNIDELFKEVFEVYPDVKEGISDLPGVYRYVNFTYESVLRGLYNAKLYLEGNGKKSSKQNNNNNGNDKKENTSIFEISLLSDDTMKTFTVGDNNAFFNSFLNDEGNKFYFTLSESASKPEALRFNESIFLGRALGFVSKQLNISDNPMYTVANRNYYSDPFTRDEVYSVTALKSEFIPLSQEQIKEYLGINTYEIVRKNGGNGSNPP